MKNTLTPLACNLAAITACFKKGSPAAMPTPVYQMAPDVKTKLSAVDSDEK